MEKISEGVVTDTCMEIAQLLMVKTRTIEGAIMVLGVTITAMLKKLPPSRRAEVVRALMNGLHHSR